jgi:PKD repeat protein
MVRTSFHPRVPGRRLVLAGVLLVAGLAVGGLALLANPALGDAAPATSSSTPPAHASSAVAAAGATRAPGTPDATVTLVKTGVTPTAISLSWTTSSTFLFVSFTVEESSAGSGGPWTAVDTINSDATTVYAQGDLLPGATYWWEVTEATDLGSSTSNVVAGTQATLAHLTVWKESATDAEFNWTNNASYGGLLSFSSYELFGRSTRSDSWSALTGSFTTETTHQYVYPGLLAGNNYSFYLNTTDACSPCGSGTGTTDLTTTSNTVALGTPLALTVSVSTDRTVIDVNESDLFLCSASGGLTPYSYAWTLNGSSAGGHNSTFGLAFAGAGSPVIGCSVTDQTPTTLSSTVAITVNPDPVANVLLNRTEADANEPISFSCSASGGTAPVTVAWTFGDNSTSTSGGVTHAYASAGTFLPACVASDAAGFSSATSVSVTIDPTLTVTDAASSAAAAPGTSLQFTASPTNGSGSYTSYAWSFGGDPSSTHGSVASYAFAAVGTFDVVVHVTDSNGVTAEGTTSVVVSALVASAIDRPTGGHPGTSLEFAASASGGAGGPYNFTWNFGDGTYGYGATAHHAYAASGTYHPTLTIRDRLGATNVSSWPTVAVTPVPGPLAWLPLFWLLVIGAIVGAIAAIYVFSTSPPVDPYGSEAMARWVPPVGPRGALAGSKMCPKCGAENPPVRRSCQVCGTPLPRNPQG